MTYRRRQAGASRRASARRFRDACHVLSLSLRSHPQTEVNRQPISFVESKGSLASHEMHDGLALDSRGPFDGVLCHATLGDGAHRTASLTSRVLALQSIPGPARDAEAF